MNTTKSQRRLFTPLSRRAHARWQKLRSRRLTLESLEPRQMLSGSPLTFQVVNDATTNIAYRYAANGAAQGSSTLVAANSAPRGITSAIASDKTWVVDANRNVYVYNSTSGVLVGSWSAGSLATPEGIATDGTDIWIVDSRSDKVFRYAGAASRLSGSQAAVSSFSLSSSNANAKDAVTDGYSLWIVDDTAKTDRVYKYNVAAGSLVGSWTIDSANKSPTGIALDPANVGDIWISDSGTDRVYKYTAAASLNGGSQAASSSFALAAGNGNSQGLVVPGRPWAETPYSVEWIKQFGTANNDWGRGVSVDPFDNIYISGAYASPNPINGSLPSGGLSFVTRLDAAGSALWFNESDPVPGVYYEGVRVEADALGNVFQMVGHGVDASGTIVAPTSLRIFASDGTPRWTVEFPGEYIFNVAVDNLGYAYLSTYEGNNVHVRKVEGATGTVVWHQTIDTGGSCNSSGIAVDQSGNIYVAAYTWGSVFGTNAGSQDGLLLKLDNSGVLQWARQFGTSQSDYAFQVAVDQFGDVYTSGQTYGSLGGPNAGARDQFLMKHDANGNLLWSRQFGNTSDETTSASWVDPSGNVYRAMTASGALGGASQGNEDVVVVKYDPAGNIRWATQIGTGALDAPVGGITGDSHGNLYITGRTTGSLGGPNAGNQDAFVIKLTPPVATGASALTSIASSAALMAAPTALPSTLAETTAAPVARKANAPSNAASTSADGNATRLANWLDAARGLAAHSRQADADPVDRAAVHDRAFADIAYRGWSSVADDLLSALA